MSSALAFTDRAVTRRVEALKAAPPPCLWPMAGAVLTLLGFIPASCAAAATGDMIELLTRIPLWTITATTLAEATRVAVGQVRAAGDARRRRLRLRAKAGTAWRMRRRKANRWKAGESSTPGNGRAGNRPRRSPCTTISARCELVEAQDDRAGRVDDEADIEVPIGEGRVTGLGQRHDVHAELAFPSAELFALRSGEG